MSISLRNKSLFSAPTTRISYIPAPTTSAAKVAKSTCTSQSARPQKGGQVLWGPTMALTCSARLLRPLNSVLKAERKREQQKKRPSRIPYLSLPSSTLHWSIRDSTPGNQYEAQCSGATYSASVSIALPPQSPLFGFLPL